MPNEGRTGSRTTDLWVVNTYVQPLGEYGAVFAHWSNIGISTHRSGVRFPSLERVFPGPLGSGPSLVRVRGWLNGMDCFALVSLFSFQRESDAKKIEN